METRGTFEVHPAEDEIEEYIFGRLTEDQCARVEEHFLICAKCRMRVERADEFILLMKQGIPASVQIRERNRWWRRPWAGAIGVAAAVVLMIAIPHRWRTELNPVPVQLVSFRGPMTEARAGSGIDLTVDCTGLDSRDGLRMEMVDSTGDRVWKGAAKPAGTNLVSARIDKRLRAGVYWVRIYSGNEFLREFGLRLRG